MNRRKGIVALMAAAMMLVAGPVLPGMATGEWAERALAINQPHGQDAVRLAGSDRYRTAVAKPHPAASRGQVGASEDSYRLKFH